jgi:energy-coupling factor transporter ATP-binding protein EcfA2
LVQFSVPVLLHWPLFDPSYNATRHLRTPFMPEPIILANALTKIVRSGDAPLTILDEVSFVVEPGASIAIVGASGSGKTTLLGLLAGLDRPTSGEIRIDGAALSVLDEDALAAMRQRLLGFVPVFQLLPALTALESDAARTRGCHRCWASRKTWLDRVGLGADNPLSAPALRRRTAACRDRARVRRRAQVVDGGRPTKSGRRDGRRGRGSDVPPESRARDHALVLVT